MSRWNRVETAYLCRLHKQHRNLYDKLHKDYKNKKIRDKALKEITKKLQKIKKNVTFKQVRMKIKTLRGQFIVELRNLQLNEDTAYEPKLWCYPRLKYLINFLDPKLIQPTKNETVQPIINSHNKKSLPCDSDDTSDNEDANSEDLESISDEPTDETTNSNDFDLVKKSSSPSKSKIKNNGADDVDITYTTFLMTLLNQVNDKESVKWRILDFVRNEINTQNSKNNTLEKNQESIKTKCSNPISQVDDSQSKPDEWTDIEDVCTDDELIEILVQNEEDIDESSEEE